MAKANPDSVFSLAGRMANRMNSIDISQERIEEILKSGDEFWPRFDAVVLKIDPGIARFVEEKRVEVIDLAIRQLTGWQEIWHKYFGLNMPCPDNWKSIIPPHQVGFDRLILVPKGISLNQVWEVCCQQFSCWKYTDRDLETAVPTNDRNPASGTYAIWVRDVVEADEETKSLSANQLKKQNVKGVTLLERLLHELKYFSETGKHLDISNWTLCSGSRRSDGCVPYVFWYDDKLKVNWTNPDNRNSNLRSRVEVSRIRLFGRILRIEIFDPAIGHFRYLLERGRESEVGLFIE